MSIEAKIKPRAKVAFTLGGNPGSGPDEYTGEYQGLYPVGPDKTPAHKVMIESIESNSDPDSSFFKIGQSYYINAVVIYDMDGFICPPVEMRILEDQKIHGKKG